MAAVFTDNRGESTGPNADSLALRGSLQSLLAGRYAMGERTGTQEKQQSPMRTVDVCPFQLSANEVTTGQFQLFVDDTSYRTEAETNADREQGRHKAVHFG